MPNLCIVLSEFDLQELLRGVPIRLSGEARPNEIALDIDHIHMDSIKATVEALIKKQKAQEEGG